MEQKEFKITDPSEVIEYEEFFNKTITSLNQQKYTSLIEERKRLNKLRFTSKINAPLEAVFSAFVEISIQDMNPNLTSAQLSAGSFYKSSKKNNRIVFRVKQFVLNEILQIEWIANNQWFSKTVTFKANQANTKTKIKFYDMIKGDTSIVGFFERHILNVYIKRQKIAFLVQILKTKQALNLFSETKSLKVSQNIEAMLNYAKKLF